MCQCDACLRLGSAQSDSDFLAMQTAAGLAEVASVSLEGATGSEGEGMVEDVGSLEPSGASAANGSRQLQQSSNAMLSAVLDAVGALQTSQAALQKQVQALQVAVEDSAAAEQDTAVQTLIATGQQQTAAGQAVIQGMLADILGKQNAAAAAAAAQMQALANLQNLQQQQLAAQAALEQSAKDQTDAIAIALQQDMLTLR